MSYEYVPKKDDVKVVCDASGFNVNMSDTVVQYNGMRVHKDFAEKRHPLDKPIYLRPAESRVKNARPELSVEDTPFLTLEEANNLILNGG